MELLFVKFNLTSESDFIGIFFLLTNKFHEFSDEIFHETLLTKEHLIIHEVELDDCLACYIVPSLKDGSKEQPNEEYKCCRYDGCLYIASPIAIGWMGSHDNINIDWYGCH